jgi:F-type H+-transporting ATPase subunit gamma
MRELVRSLLKTVDPEKHPLLQPGKGTKVALLVVSSDRGLCGGYNSNIVNETMRMLREQFAGKKVELTVVGKKAFEALRRRKCNIVKSHIGLLDRYSVNSDTAVILPLVADFVKGEVGEIYVLYNEFKTAITQRIAVERLLPYEPEPHDGKKNEEYYIFEPSAEQLVFSLLYDNLRAQMHRILHEAMASEQGARMAAMDAATNNARDVIAKLTLKYNRVRQDAITKEVVEIVSGAEAL